MIACINGTRRRAKSGSMARSKEVLTVAELGEKGLLGAIARRLARGAPGVVLGIGDDAAVLETIGPNAVLSTDMLVEGIDFEAAWAAPADIGSKAAAVNLSDLAAMGARPRGCLASLALRAETPVADVLALLGALQRTARLFGAPLVGGDLSRTHGPMVVSVTVVGEVERNRALRRGCGEVGDLVLASGTFGGAAAGLAILRAGGRKPVALVRRQLRPVPRVALGRALARSGLVRSCADVSDGLAADAQLLAGRGAMVAIDPTRVLLQRGVAEVARRGGRDPLELALAGGEDFELVLAVAAANLRRVQRLGAAVGVRLRVIGEIVARQRGDAAPIAGFDHFRASAVHER
jgi:thiamine-monophosphate kinase